jgi:hypothetical protein
MREGKARRKKLGLALLAWHIKFCQQAGCQSAKPIATYIASRHLKSIIKTQYFHYIWRWPRAACHLKSHLSTQVILTMSFVAAGSCHLKVIYQHKFF